MGYSFEEAIQRVLSTGSIAVGAEFFDSMAKQLAIVLSADAVLIGQLMTTCKVVESLATVVDGELLEPFTYELENTPCRQVVGRDVCCFDDTMYRFPKDKMIVDLSIQGYVGVPLYDKNSTPSGIIVAMWRKPIPETSFATAVIQMFAGRAGAEIDRLRLERRQAGLQARLAQNITDLTNVVAGLSHDLKSALVNISGFSTELNTNREDLKDVLRPANLTAAERADVDVLLTESEQFLGFVRSGSTRISAMIDGIRELTMAGLEEPEPRTIDMQDTAQQLLVGSRFAANAADVVTELIGELPNCFADPSHITRILGNLIDNGIKFASPDGPKRVSVSGHIADGRAVYEVVDNGVGIQPGELEWVFDLFHRTPQAGAVPGQGMGLAVSRRLVLANGGSIQVESVYGEGTTVRVALPLPALDTEDDAQA